MTPNELLKYHVSEAIERGEGEAITGITLPSLSEVETMPIESVSVLWADICMPSRRSPLNYENARGKQAAAIKRVFNAAVKRLNSANQPENLKLNP